MKISDILLNPTTNKHFPLVLFPELENYEEMRKYYYLNKLNHYFGVLPTSFSTETSLKMFYFFLGNLSQTIIDFAYSLDSLYETYFTSNEVTKKYIKDIREYFKPLIAEDPFQRYQNLWSISARFLFFFMERFSFEFLKMYFSFLKTKVNRLYVYSYSKTECSEEGELEIKDFFDSIRRKFFYSISATKNEELRSFLLNSEFAAFSSLEDPVVNDLNFELNFLEIYETAERTSTSLFMKVEELFSEFQLEYDKLYNELLNKVFSQEFPEFRQLVNEIGETYAYGLLEYLKT